MACPSRAATGRSSAISFGTSLFVVDGAIANVALPTIARDLGVSNGAVTNVVTVYQLVLVMLLLPFSSLGDRIGHRQLYQLGQVVFLVASAATLFADQLRRCCWSSARCRRSGRAWRSSVSAAMLREIYPANSLGSGMGINSVIVASSAALAPTLGGYIVAHLEWQLGVHRGRAARGAFAAAGPLAAGAGAARA